MVSLISIWVGVHRSTSLMSSSLLLQQCPACLVRRTCIVFVMGGKCPYSWSLVGCCRRASVGRPARTYIQQLCEDTGCNPEDLPEAMSDREKWRETVRDIRAGGATWWWWFLSNMNNSLYYWSFVCTQFNDFKYCYVLPIIQLNINNLFTHS